MIVKVNSSFAIPFIVTNDAGQRVTDDSPVVEIKNISTGEYFNGMFFAPDVTSLMMSHKSNGLYLYDYLATDRGEFEITCRSDVHRSKTTMSVIVADETDKTYYCNPGKEYYVAVDRANEADSALLRIFREEDLSYWNGEEWQDNPDSWIELPYDMEKDQFFYSFVVESFLPYKVEVQTESGTSMIFFVQAAEGEYVEAPVILSSSTFAANDGSDSRVLNALREPVQNAVVSCYDVKNPNDKKLIAEATTDSDGKWSMAVPPGRYYFLFRCDGFIAKGFEREVM